MALFIAAFFIGAMFSELRREMNAEQETELQAIKKEEEDLKNQMQMLSAEVRDQRIAQLRKRTQNYQIAAQIKQTELTQTNAKGRLEIMEAIKPIYTDLFKEYNATMMIDKSQLSAVTPDIEITAEVLKRLDEKITKVKFERVTLKNEGE